MKPDHPHQPPIVSKRLLQGIVLICFILLVLTAGTAWRPLDPTTLARVQSGVVSLRGIVPTPVQAADINEQTRSSTGIILATVVIMLIILGGTFGATRRKSQ